MIRRSISSLTVLALLSSIAPLPAQQENAPPASAREHDTSLGQISVIDKFLAIEGAIGRSLKPPKTTDDQWAAEYEKLYRQFSRNGQLSALPGAGANEVINALALGVKASDAVIALKAHNVEELNKCAEQIEQLAIKLGATKRELGMADTVKRHASAGHWLDAFLALGFLQRAVINYLRDNPERKYEATLVIVGGWIQGGRCVTDVIDKNYGAEVSNVLREPRLIDLIKKNMDELPAKYQSEPVVTKLNKALPDIRKRVAVGFHDPVKQEEVKWLHTTFDGLVQDITTK